MCLDRAPRRAEPTGTADDVDWPALLGLACFATLTLMALTEHFRELPAAVAAYGAAWRVARW
ncbi:hypothetical protein [Nocardioides sp. cx-173]|uniref:hypothetical protein n=1 Tax=Nocardioides sp. cx-173 TaxID=2898796 RepID=UPI001E5AF203|nr:hypothetical protein [Nocardioides sp. cx-173]MCD4526875.1 hypothetical protein [Nocardioides sp. cx-173]UGB41336.1 hypothetical protein LQ940_18445 [Nocardioides sp. cx-173]